MKRVDFEQSGIFVKGILKEKIIEQGKLDKELGDIFIKKAYRLRDGKMKVIGYQYSKEFPFECKIDWENKE